MFFKSWCCVGSVALLVSFAGCQGQRDVTTNQPKSEHGDLHDHEPSSQAHAKSFRESVQDIEVMTAKICQAFVDGSPEDVHDTLHVIGHSLEKLPALAAKEGKLSPEQMSAVNEAVEALFVGFGKLDDTMHGGDEVDIKSIERKLAESLVKINEVAK